MTIRAVLTLLIAALFSSCGTKHLDSPPPTLDNGGDPPEENATADHEWVTQAVEGERIFHRTFHSKAAGREISYHVFVPMPYERQVDRRFPVLYWLHGSGGGLPGILPLSQHLAQAMRDGLMPVTLVVFPNGLPNGMWVDWMDGSVSMETIVIHELIPHIDATFRTVAAREGRIIEGFSMGGYGAARLAFKHHDLFWAASMLGAGPLQPELIESPRVDPVRREQVLRDVYGDDMEYFREVSPWVLAEQNRDALASGLRIRMAIGELDETFEFNQDFHEHLLSLAVPHEFHAVPDVGHAPLALRLALGDALWSFYQPPE